MKTKLRPLSPIFGVDKSFGAIDIGNTPQSDPPPLSYGPLTHIAQLTTFNTSTTSLPINLPTGYVPIAGDVAIACVKSQFAGAWDGAGWTYYGTAGDTLHHVLYRVMLGSETSPLPPLIPAVSSSNQCLMTIWRGCNTSIPIKPGSAVRSSVSSLMFMSEADTMLPTTIAGSKQFIYSIGSGSGSFNAQYSRSILYDQHYSADTNNAYAGCASRTRIFPSVTPVSSTFMQYTAVVSFNGVGNQYAYGFVIQPIDTYTPGLTIPTISIIGTSSAVGTVPLSFALPAGTEPGDVVVLSYYTNTSLTGNNTQPSFPFRQIDQGANSLEHSAWGLMPATLPSAITIFAVTGTYVATATTYRGVDPTCPIDFYSARMNPGTSDLQPQVKCAGSVVAFMQGSKRTFGANSPIGTGVTLNGFTAGVTQLSLGGTIYTAQWNRLNAPIGAVTVPVVTFGSGIARNFSAICLRPENSVP